jgi:hypothetical protein
MPRACLAAVIGRVSASAQWIYPIPGIPRTGDGQPNPHGTRSQGRRRQARSLRPVAAPANPCPRRPGLEMGPNLEDFMRPGEKTPAPAPSGRGALPETAGAISWRTGPQDVRSMSSRTGCSPVRRSRSGAEAHPVRRIRMIPPDFLRSTPAPYSVPAGVAGLFHRPLGPQLVRSRHARLQPPELVR